MCMSSSYIMFVLIVVSACFLCVHLKDDVHNFCFDMFLLLFPQQVPDESVVTAEETVRAVDHRTGTPYLPVTPRLPKPNTSGTHTEALVGHHHALGTGVGK